MGPAAIMMCGKRCLIKRSGEKSVESWVRNLSGDRQNRRSNANDTCAPFWPHVFSPDIGRRRSLWLALWNELTLTFSRIVYGTEVLVAYNVSDQPRNDFVIVDNSLHKIGDALSFLFGGSSNVPDNSPDGATFVQLQLAPRQFVILQ
jgi:hypothetical protein